MKIESIKGVITATAETVADAEQLLALRVSAKAVGFGQYNVKRHYKKHLPCKDCPFVGKNKLSLAIHAFKMHGVRKEPKF